LSRASGFSAWATGQIMARSSWMPFGTNSSTSGCNAGASQRCATSTRSCSLRSQPRLRRTCGGISSQASFSSRSVRMTSSRIPSRATNAFAKRWCRRWGVSSPSNRGTARQQLCTV
jgi:hypothetical protein